MSILLAHEIAHCFCLTDAEGYESSTHQAISAANGGCIMDGFYDLGERMDFYEKVLRDEQNAICEKCSEFLVTHLDVDSLNS